tara:strand:- start:1979 stop:2233 length:255 start_codon:yes stop_codon:yes gene_type:complete
MSVDLRRLTREFLLNEGKKKKPSVRAYAENVIDILTKIKASSQAEQRKIDMAKEHLKDIKSLTRRLEIKIESLERQLEELKKDV